MTTIPLNESYTACKTIANNNIAVYFVADSYGDSKSGVYEYWSEFIAELKKSFSPEDIAKIKKLKREIV